MGRSLLFWWGSAGFDSKWGIPHCLLLSLFTTYILWVTPDLSFGSADLTKDAYLLLFGENAESSLRSGADPSFLSPSLPYPMSGLSLLLLEGDKLGHGSSLDSTVPSPSRRIEQIVILSQFFLRRFSFHLSSQAASTFLRRGHADVFSGLGLQSIEMGLINPKAFMSLLPSLSASMPTLVWGNLAFLVNFLMIIGGFTKIITEAYLYLRIYFSYMKSLSTVLLTVDSPEKSTSTLPLSSFSLEMRPVLPQASFMRNVSPPNNKWRCVSLSIIVLSSCVAVRLGPEDATGVISIISRDADRILTSQFKVTKYQVSSAAMFLPLTHSSLVSSPLSFYLRGFSTCSLFGLWFVVIRVWLNSFFACS